MRFLTVEQVAERQRRQQRLTRLAIVCTVVLALVWLIAAGPADVTIAGGHR